MIHNQENGSKPQMTQLLEVADREFKATIIDILKNLTKMVNIV